MVSVSQLCVSTELAQTQGHIYLIALSVIIEIELDNHPLLVYIL